MASSVVQLPSGRHWARAGTYTLSCFFGSFTSSWCTRLVLLCAPRMKPASAGAGVGEAVAAGASVGAGVGEAVSAGVSVCFTPLLTNLVQAVVWGGVFSSTPVAPTVAEVVAAAWSAVPGLVN